MMTIYSDAVSIEHSTIDVRLLAMNVAILATLYCPSSSMTNLSMKNLNNLLALIPLIIEKLS